MPSDVTTPEFEARAEWVWRVLGIRLTAHDRANAVIAEQIVSRYERLDAAHGPVLDGLAAFPGWEGAAELRRDHVAQETELDAIERSLRAIDAAVVAQAEDLVRRLDAVERWQADALRQIAAIGEQQAQLRRDCAALRADIEATAGPHRGEIRRRLDDLASELEAAVAANIERGAIASPRGRIAGFAERLAEQRDDIARRFDAAQRDLDQQRTRMNNLVPFSEAEDQPDLIRRRDAVDTALDGNDLEGARAALTRFSEALATIERERTEARDAENRYNTVKPVLERISDLTEADFSNAANAHAVAAIQERINEAIEGFDDDLREHGWNYVVFAVADLERLLPQAMAILNNDQAAAHAVAQAQQAAAAAAALAQQQAQAAQLLAQQNAAAQFNANVQAATLAGDAQFGGGGLIDRVWRKTKQDAPHATNSSVGGAYSYNDIMAAIALWNHVPLAAGFVQCHVPGNGSIQDKRPKGRNEVQANFISDWGANGRVNVHVNLRGEDWHLV